MRQGGIMEQQFSALLARAEEEIKTMVDAKDIEAFRIKYMGKKGEVAGLMQQMKHLSSEERPLIGKIANQVKQTIDEMVKKAMATADAESLAQRLADESIDVTLPARLTNELGHIHPVNKTLRELVDIFTRMGYSVVEGPQIDNVYRNFDALNSPEDHPARGMSDTFYFDAERLLRTHTSPVQVQVMKENNPPIRIISFGRCFRNDTPDATHSPMFHQMEGLVVGKEITMADLKGTLEIFVKELFGEDAQINLRPHYFPFTEPSGEVDVSCFKCGGKGCRLCKGSGWIEILGCGMVHPNVLRECGIDPDVYTGFAFGMGAERITMLKHECDDIRVLYENDVRMLKQW